MAEGTVTNIINGSSDSASGRQALTDFCDCELFDGVLPLRVRGRAALHEAWTADRLRLLDPATPALEMIEKITVAVERAEYLASRRAAASEPAETAALGKLIESVRRETANAAMEEILAKNPTTLAAKWRAVFGVPHPEEEVKA